MSTATMEKKKTGPPLTLTEDVLSSIKEYAVKGCNMREIAENTGLNYKTLRNWHYQNVGQLADHMQTWEMEYTLSLAEAVGRDILTMDVLKDDGTVNPALKAIQQREAEYTRDALVIARKKWSKKDAININVQLPQPILGDVFDSLPKATVVDPE